MEQLYLFMYTFFEQLMNFKGKKSTNIIKLKANKK